MSPAISQALAALQPAIAALQQAAANASSVLPLSAANSIVANLLNVAGNV